MSVFRTGFIYVVMILTIAACAQDSKTIIPEEPKNEAAAPVVPNPPIAEPAKQQETKKAVVFLNTGIKYYEGGKYNQAEKDLKEALKLGLIDTADQVTAHKYLAFIYSFSKRKTLCRKSFEQAFELDPNFILTPAEADHPMWGPIYRKVKAKQKPVKTTP